MLTADGSKDNPTTTMPARQLPLPPLLRLLLLLLLPTATLAIKDGFIGGNVPEDRENVFKTAITPCANPGEKPTGWTRDNTCSFEATDGG